MPVRCTSHGISVGEHIEYFRAYRTYYRSTGLDEAAVSALIVKEMERLGIMGSCCRNMILNVDSRDDFYARREAYAVMSNTVTSVTPAKSAKLASSS